MGKQWKQWETLFSWAPKSLQMVTGAMKFKKHSLLGRKAMTKLDSILESRDVTLPTKACLVKAMVFPVVMYICESRTIKGWVPKHWCFQIVVLEKTLESPLDCKEIKPVISKKSTLNICWKDWCWSWSSNTLATSWEEPIYWKRFWCWERRKKEKGVAINEMVK